MERTMYNKSRRFRSSQTEHTLSYTEEFDIQILGFCNRFHKDQQPEACSELH